MLMKTPLDTTQALALTTMLRLLRKDSEPWRSANWRAKRGIAPRPKSGYEWKQLGEEKLIHVIHKQNGPRPVLVISPVMALVEKPGKKYTGEKLRELRAERGVGKVKRA